MDRGRLFLRIAVFDFFVSVVFLRVSFYSIKTMYAGVGISLPGSE